jgi:TRAP-type C4-dicarboxylate transport system permease small subunit
LRRGRLERARRAADFSQRHGARRKPVGVFPTSSGAQAAVTLPHGDDDHDASALLEDTDEHIDLSDIRFDDSLAFLTFWVLAGVVFLQFFTRYVLNDSYAWTEEIARYLLIGVTFFGLFAVIRRESNIAVEIFYRWMPPRLRLGLSTFVDVVSVAFYGAMAWLCIELAQRTRQSMAIVNLPKSIIYWSVAFGLAMCTLYAAFVAWRHWRDRSSPLTRIARPVQAPHRPGME